MTEAELIARLRDGCNLQQRDGENAADLIEALIKERDEADDLAKAAFADGASNNIRLAETSYDVKWLEAKLAKAVDYIKQAISAWDKPHYGDEGTKIDNAFDGFELLRKALADQLVKERDEYKAAAAIWQEDFIQENQRLYEAKVKLAMATEALQNLHHAVCGETGFASAVRNHSGKAYPWEALDMADAQTRAVLAELEGK